MVQVRVLDKVSVRGHGRLGGSPASPTVLSRRSTTNVQVEGVDEADIVKTDGKHVYFALNGALRIASVTPPQLVSVTPLQGKVKELFLQGNRAVVYVALGGSTASRCTLRLRLRSSWGR